MAVTQQEINALIDDLDHARWNAYAPVGTPAFVTYSFMQAVPAYDTNARPGFAAFSDAQKAGARQALDLWAKSSGLVFLEVASGGDIQFGFHNFDGTANSGFAGYAYHPSIYPEYGTDNDIGGDIYFNTKNVSDTATGNGFSTVLHEIGHAIGLKHPFEGSPTLPAAKDNKTFTVMSYTGTAASALGELDIAAVQYLYGTSDYIHVFSGTSLAAVGTDAAQAMVGTNLPDVLAGFAGDDTLYGMEGNDWLQGDLGSDTLHGGAGNDTLVPGGFAANTSVDTAYGGAGNDLIVQANGSGTLHGEDGNDFLWGAMGHDTLRGGRGSDEFAALGGNDTFVFDRNDLGGGDVDTIHGFGDFGADQDVIQFTGGVMRSWLQITAEPTGARLTINYTGGEKYQLFVWGMRPETIADDLVFV